MAGPLQGIKILDFTTLLPGPYATMMLADMGAEVLRVVSGTRLDLTTLLPPFIGKENISGHPGLPGPGEKVPDLEPQGSPGRYDRPPTSGGI